MGSIKKHIRFWAFFLLFTLALVAIRTFWITNALPAKALVLYTGETTHRIKQYFPVVSYHTVKGDVQTAGTYNLPITPGESVNILYDPNDVKKFRINTTFWLWYDIWSWYRLLLVVIALYYGVLFIVKRSPEKKSVPYDWSEEAELVRLSRIRTAPASKPQLRLPKWLKALLVLLLPITLLAAGEWGKLPYATGLGVIVVLTYMGLFTFSRGEATKE